MLSVCTGQVTHALLTRPPLSLQNVNSEEDQLSSFVRLACVKHAASVRPEPGSNSLIKCLIRLLKITTSYLSFYCFWFFKPFLKM